MRLEPPHPLVGLAVASVLALALLITRPAPSAAAAGTLQGDIPHDGTGLVVWGGGTTTELSQAAEQQGCHTTTLWTTSSGHFAVYIYGAPDVVNAPFIEQFPGTSMPPGTALVIACSGPVGPSQSAIVAISSIENEFANAAFDGINRARVENGRSTLILDTRLRSAAEKYASLVFSKGELSHSFDGQPWERAQREGFPSQYVGEVIVSRGSSEGLNVPHDAPELVTAWMNSPPHRDIIIGKDYSFVALGVGCATGIDRAGLNTVVCVAMLGTP
ncbi:MAG: CAP domain-containing protein [Dehalococcoidia bacterium]|nr:CAP domain-containing protein [Dehalococcoidia bacterium]HRC63222.1 CAP domain-containing protein [Dehalococcoidia bacterium]